MPMINFIGCYMLVLPTLPWFIPYIGSIGALILASTISVALFLIGHKMWKKHRIIKFDRKVFEM